MKKTMFSIILILSIVSIFLILRLFLTQDQPEQEIFIPENPQWHLPEGVKSRFGKGAVKMMQYSPDGNILAVVSSIGVWLYDADSGEALFLLSGHTSIINSIASRMGKQSQVAVRTKPFDSGM